MSRQTLCFFLFIFMFPGVLPAQDIKYTDGNDSWNPDSLGNHRAVVHFNGKGKVARVLIPWRRHDDSVAGKRIIVQDPVSGNKILNVMTGRLDNEAGEIFFEPVSGEGDYYIYYMPYRNEGRSNYPKGVYLRTENTASTGWLASLTPSIPFNTVAKEIQSVNAFNSFFPMEIAATREETSRMLASHKNQPFLVFPEDRTYPIKMKNYLPYRWIKNGAKPVFSGNAGRGENYTYQLGVYALQSLERVTVQFSDLKSGTGALIPAQKIYCLNTAGTDYTGKSFVKEVSVAPNTVQALWCGIDIPTETKPGKYTGRASILARGVKPVTVSIQLNVGSNVLADGGINEPWKQTRLTWLNSTLAQDNTVIAPYTPLKREGMNLSLLGRKVILNEEGFPAQIQTFFTPEMTGYQQTPNDLLTEPIHFHFIRKADGKAMKLAAKNFAFTHISEGTVTWKASCANDTLQLDVSASLEFDGFMTYTVRLTALQDAAMEDINMHIPFTKESAAYMMGLGQKGGYRPENLDWKWDVGLKNQDGAWVGTVNAGLQYSLRDEKYVRPLNTNFYLQKPLLLPASWGNENKGGIRIGEKGKSILANNYSGERQLKKGDTLYYNFTLLITPFHPINTEFQWTTRFYHKYDNLDSIRATGATVANIHHATPINPWINYPFIEYRRMKSYIDSAHQKGLRVKIYNTVRELSNRAYELYALRSLGHEIYSPGKGGGFSWLQEHVGGDYIAAWFVPEIKDAALVNSGMSRWHNYYVEGMNWLVRNTGIDGIYLDDVAFDRVTMKRIKRVLTEDGHPGIIDLHSANQFNKNDGFNNSANLYMEHFPYLNRLWFGEYFDYENNGPDFFLTEVSGIPFGLMGEMLQNGGNPWRGMIYGMTNRYPWSEEADPRPLWKFWDDAGMKGTEMIGYWSPACPVKSDTSKVLVTVYRKEKSCIVSMASWAENDLNVRLTVDWNKLGIDPSAARITAPAIPNFQPAMNFSANETIPVPKGRGWLLVISGKN